MDLFPVLQTALGIGLLIFVHELGHYVCARLAGVRVLTFSLGFGPRLLGFQRNGTDYRLAAIPLGGYVRVAGEDPTERRNLEPDDLYAKGFLARAAFFSGGVVMNVLFALIAFPIVFHSGVPFTAPVLGGVAPGGAAWAAGLRPGDRVLSVGGKRMYSYENMLVEVALAGEAANLEVERAGERLPVVVRPTYSKELGVRTMDVSPPLSPEPPAIQVEPNSAAAAAGLSTGDRLVTVNGAGGSARALDEALQQIVQAPPKPIAVTVRRNGETHDVTYAPAPREGPPRIGVERASRRVAAIPDDLEPARRLGLQPGDHVLAVDGHTLTTDLATALREGGSRDRDSSDQATGNRTLRLQVLRRAGADAIELRATLTPTEVARLGQHLVLAHDTEGVAVVPQPGTPAERTGVQPGDEIVRVGDTPIRSWSDLQQAVKAAGEKQVDVVVRRGQNREVTLQLQAEAAKMSDLGFLPQRKILHETYRVEGVWPSIQAGFTASVDLIKQLYVTLKKLFIGEVDPSNLGGIITISRFSYDYAQSGWERFLYFLGLLSINLAFINVLPIPVLDGGHLLFLLIERVKGSPVSPKVLTYSQIIGLVFVVALMVFVTFNDIKRLL